MTSPGVGIGKRDRGAEDDLLVRELRDVDDLGMGQLVLQLPLLGVEMPLALLGRVILGVLREVAVRAGLFDVLDVLGPLHLDDAVELLLELVVALFGHGDLLRHDE